MEKEFTDLIKYLDEEITLCKELEFLENKKTEIMLKKDLNLLNNISMKEEGYSKKLDQIEEERQKLSTLIGRKLLITNDITLSKLIKSLPSNKNDISTELKKRGEVLKETVIRLKKVNNINNSILEDSLKYFDFSINLLSNASNELYNRKGSDKAVNNSSFLIDKKA